MITKEDWELLRKDKSPEELKFFDEEQFESLSNTHQRRTGTDLELEYEAKPNIQEMRILLIGEVGSGRSSLGNSIVGEGVFRTGAGSTTMTKTVQVATGYTDGVNLTVIDTPDLFGAGGSTSNLTLEKAKVQYIGVFYFYQSF